ncbi:MAG: DMT family transporter [Boseongicola sp.]|nr:DMT family transporter [Boseongicola sp.]
MAVRERIDTTGALALIGFSALLGFNQVVIRVVNDGLQPVFFAGLRSVGAIFCIWLWFAIRKRSLGLKREDLKPGLLIGAFFAAEFILLFNALDLTTVTRVSVIFYSMPLWLALMAHFFIPGERITVPKAIGQALAFVGVAIAIIWRSGGGEASLVGDLLALFAALCWAGIAMIARTGLKDVASDRQLVWQVFVSAPILMLAAPLFGPLIRDLQPIHLWGLLFQIVAVVTFGFALWLWLLSVYPAASVAAFSFLTPVFGVFFGWIFLNETLGLPVIVALVLVSLGLILINRPVHVPQKV